MPETTAQQETTAEFTPITSQEQLDGILKNRLNRERAKYADYEELKGKAARLDEIEEAAKSELEKAKEAAASATAELQSLKASIALDKAKDDIAAEYGLPASILRGSSADELREHAKAISEQVKLYPSTKDKGEGRKPTPEQTKNEFVSNLFRKD